MSPQLVEGGPRRREAAAGFSGSTAVKPWSSIPSIDGIPYGALIWDGFYIKTSRTGRSSVKIEHIGPRLEVTDKTCAWVKL